MLGSGPRAVTAVADELGWVGSDGRNTCMVSEVVTVYRSVMSSARFPAILDLFIWVTLGGSAPLLYLIVDSGS